MAEQLFGKAFQQQFFERHASLQPLMDLFELAPGVYFYAKDRKSRFVRLNKANLAVYGVNDEESLLGKTDRDFHPPALAEGYIAEDHRVMEGGKPIVNKTWLVPFLNGSMQWFVSSKLPLLGSRGECIGICGVMHTIATPKEQLDRFQKLAPAVRYLEQRFREHVQMTEIAEFCGLSSTHVHRLFRRLLRMSPTEYLLALRLQEARRLLVTTDHPLSVIAVDTGFFDQSHFSKRFRKMTGMTPTQFRKTFQ
ncbi:MAG: AraC family transcriptional regulator [Bythopirellula sp.]|nr:AraC family transcriptional regulator [Bythopirellula sp.]